MPGESEGMELLNRLRALEKDGEHRLAAEEIAYVARALESPSRADGAQRAILGVVRDAIEGSLTLPHFRRMVRLAMTAREREKPRRRLLDQADRRVPAVLVAFVISQALFLLLLIHPPDIATRRICIESINAGDGSALVWVPAGEFIMGDDELTAARPPRRQYVADFCIGKYEVTNRQFARFVKESGYKTESSWADYAVPGRETHPVIRVTWHDARAYCRWAGLRLPKEAEWEKAARGVDGRVYPWGNVWRPRWLNWGGAQQEKWREWDNHASAPSLTPTEPVGRYPKGASPFGALDMAGNVWEWCEDWFLPYPGSKSHRVHWSRRERVIRGGAWTTLETKEFSCANRGGISADDASSDCGIGFRVCRSGAPDAATAGKASR